MGQGLLEGVELARQLAETNAKLREAFDALSEQKAELGAAHAALMHENITLREQLSFSELALAMESYPSQLPSSIAAQVSRVLASFFAA